MTTLVKFAMVGLATLLVLIVIKHGFQFGRGDFFKEGKLIREINAAPDPMERKRLITKLEGIPEKYVCFGNRWLGIHAPRSPGGWDEEGFDHHRTNMPRDIEILTGVLYGVSDIENGGLHQFFINGTGGMAPEMVEWFERYEMEESAGQLKRAMAVFGETYPRSQEARNRFLEKFEGETREEYDPFYEMDGPFYESIEKDGMTLDDRLDHWVREIWGFKSLHTELPPVDWEPPVFSEKDR